jgi:transcriptional regulator with XRE-family HTH domain
MSKSEKKFTSLGNHLKYVREQARQSLAEVSGAVEIDEQYLERIEQGLVRPAEDILLLLISHFGVKDREAVKLWESADYDSELPEEFRITEETLANKSVVMVMATDTRTLYTDEVSVSVNPSGLTLEFSHNLGKDKSAPVASLGMSHAQAEMVVKAMQTALLHAKYGSGVKLLPPFTPEA